MHLATNVILQKTGKLPVTKFGCKTSAYQIFKENLKFIVSNTNSQKMAFYFQCKKPHFQKYALGRH